MIIRGHDRDTTDGASPWSSPLIAGHFLTLITAGRAVLENARAEMRRP